MTASIKEAAELKPCPFCGSPADIEPWHGGAPTKRMVSCSAVDCEVSPCVTGETEIEAVTHWNTRVAPASLSCGEARERIARIIDPDAFTQFTHSFQGQNAAIKKANAILATGCVPGEASIRADQIIMSRALVEQAHAAMRETGWHLAPAHATSGDGVIEAAVAEIEERFAAAIRAGRGE